METPIITATEVAIQQIKRILEQEQLTDQAVRVGISERGASGFQYQLEFCDQSEKGDTDVVLAQGDITFYVLANSVDELRGTTLDYVDTGFSAGFKFDNPNVTH